MRRSAIGIAIGFVLGIGLVPGTIDAKLLYEEYYTITLDDGTHVFLVLDDYGVKRDQADSGSARVRQAKFEYLQRVRQAKGESPGPPVAIARPANASAAQDQRLQKLSSASPLEANLSRLRDHRKGRLLWPGRAGPEKRYYYLPPPPKVATDADGRPQFLFMKFTSDRSAEEGGVSGGILHFLCEYGLTPQQEAELKRKLASEIPGAKLMGPVQMQQGEGESTFNVLSAIVSEGGFTERVIASGKAPILPGQKVAAAARLDAAGAVLLEESLKRPTSDITVEFDLSYTAFMPAFEGTITFDWEKFEANVDDWTRDYEHKHKRKWDYARAKWVHTHTYNTEELRELYDFMCEHEAIRIEWTESMVDERVEAIRQILFRFMETSFFERTDFVMPEDDEDIDEQMATPRDRGRRSEFVRFVAKGEEALSNKTMSIKVTLPVKVPYISVGNISGAWFREARRGNPELFAEVNVDDPFFQQRQVTFTLDLDAIEIFDEAINFVTVEVRKDRPRGRDFHTSFTLTKDEVSRSGPTRVVTYAKMRDDSPEVFDYLVRWSLRGGVEWPSNPGWTRGQWEGVTLVPPVMPLLVEAEADLEELRELEITRATVELRYNQFGTTRTDTRSLQLSVAKGEPLDSTFIFRDRNNTRWDYRVNLYHKRLGRQEGSWQRGGEDGYIYCAVPERERLESEAVDALTDALGD